MKKNLNAISEKFAQRDQRAVPNLNNAKVTTRELWKFAGERFDELADDLEAAINAPETGRSVFVDSADPDDEERSGWHRWSILRTAERLGYFVDVLDFMCWVRLGLRTEAGRSDILLSLHTIGPGYSGLCGASLCFYRRGLDDNGDSRVTYLQPATPAPFEIYFRDPLESATRRFSLWLNNGLNRAVTIWAEGE